MIKQFPLNTFIRIICFLSKGLIFMFSFAELFLFPLLIFLSPRRCEQLQGCVLCQGSTCHASWATVHGGATAPTPRPPPSMSHCAAECLIVPFAGVLQTATMKIVQCYGSSCIPGLDHVLGATPCRDGVGERRRRGTTPVGAVASSKFQTQGWCWGFFLQRGISFFD